MPTKSPQIRIIVGLLVLLLFVLSGSYGIRCFQCNSAIDQHCDTLNANDTHSKYYKSCEQHVDPGDPVDEDKEKKVYFCRKIEQHIKDMKDTVRVIRKCGWEKSPNKDCYKFEDDDHKEIVCQCFTDACNSAHSFYIPRHSMYLVITSCVLVYMQRLF